MSNLAILSLVIKDINLHSPMYFFLASLSLVDIGISSTTVPKMMVGLWVQNNISLKGCFTQIFFFHVFAALPFCDGYIVKNFFCDFKPVIKLACTDTHFNEVFLAAFTGISAILAFVMLILSYCFILKHLLKIRSSEGRSKAFSTCSSHFIIVMLYYGATICIYIRPASESSIEKDRVATIIFTVITPALNPIIYTLRNKDIKKSLRQLVLRANTQRVAVQ
ncbi:olfactory receptor 1G1-like [Leptodactylus fuscus]